MKTRIISIVVALLLCATSTLFADFVGLNGAKVTNIYTSTDFEPIGGLAVKNSTLYFGQFQKMKQMDLGTLNVSDNSDLPGNNGISFVQPNGNKIFCAYYVSFSAPYPYYMGFTENGTYTNILEEDGIYDAAVNPDGDLFIVANPNTNGTKILRYDSNSASLVEIADMGEYSGGLCFDNDGNMYYAHQINGILAFTPSQVTAGGLNVGNARIVNSVIAGYLGCDSKGNIYATKSIDSVVAAYDSVSGNLINEFVHDPGQNWKAGKLAFDNSDPAHATMYLIYNDYWTSYKDHIYKVKLPIPEPSIIFGLCVAAYAFLQFRK